MRHPKRAITRDIRTRRPKRPEPAADGPEASGWPESLRVQDAMTPGPATARRDMTVGTAWRLMGARRIRHLPVLDAQGRLIGIVTERDLRELILDPAVQAELAGASDAGRLRTVEEVMTWGAVTARSGAKLGEAARIMHQRKVGALPVVDRDRLVGILTVTDLVRTLDAVLREGIVSRPERWGREA